MKQKDYRNSMVVLCTLVRSHHRTDGDPVSMLQIYQTSRDAGVGLINAVDLALTFGRSAERLVEVGLAIEVPPSVRHDHAYSPSPIGLLVYYQHPELFPRPTAGDRSASPQVSAEHWRGVLAGFGIGLSILAGVLGWAGVTILAGWLLCFGALMIVLYFAVPARWFRLLR